MIRFRFFKNITLDSIWKMNYKGARKVRSSGAAAMALTSEEA